MTTGNLSQIVGETLQTNPSTARASNVIAEVLVARTTTPANQIVFQGVVRELLTRNTVSVKFDGVVREILASNVPPPAPIPVFPVLPVGFPTKLTPIMDTIVGQVKSLREMRGAQRTFPLWELELLFEELRDQTQNQTAYAPLATYVEYMTLVQTWLAMYGQTNVFAFDAPWDDSRLLQQIGFGDGSNYVFTAYRTWGAGAASLLEPVGMIDAITQIKVGGVVVPPTQYMFIRNKIYFQDSTGKIYPPASGAAITVTFSFYYLCRFVSDSQQFEEFMKNRYTVPSLKFRSVYWP